ncbi:hypothetical protein D9757_000246 [Collybiopsis confluens]|uniref:CWF21 domain-containing protein n=1 Tax=Collybiopsis confluens TaxID=2823264 RepID=A0A8H5I2D6_9AGAR|nr:hypothetical protein D9757_000246 [Collybiopsis confluens]
MYNGIGLTTPRGSGTNGYVIRNLSTLRSYEPAQDRAAAWDVAPPKHREPDQGILDHERKRQVEVKCLELQLELEDKGIDEDEIENQVDALRAKLNANLDALAPLAKRLKPSDTHGIAAAKKSELDKMARALGTRSNYSEGEAFDREKQEEMKLKRQADREERERRKEEDRAKMAESKAKWETEKRERDRLRRREEDRLRREREEGGADLGRRQPDMPPPPLPSRDRYRGRDRSPPRGSRTRRDDSRSRSPRRRSPSPRSSRRRSPSNSRSRSRSRSPPPPPPPRVRRRSVSPLRHRSRSPISPPRGGRRDRRSISPRRHRSPTGSVSPLPRDGARAEGREPRSRSTSSDSAMSKCYESIRLEVDTFVSPLCIIASSTAVYMSLVFIAIGCMISWTLNIERAVFASDSGHALFHPPHTFTHSEPPVRNEEFLYSSSSNLIFKSVSARNRVRGLYYYYFALSYHNVSRTKQAKPKSTPSIPSSPSTKYKATTHPLDSAKSTATQAALTRGKDYLLPVYARPDFVLSHGKGSYVWDSEGRKYLDFSAGIAVNALGHADEGVVKVISEQSQTLLHTSNVYHNQWAGKLAELLVTLTQKEGGLGYPAAKKLDGSKVPGAKVFFANSGTEANEGALKIARKVGKDRWAAQASGRSWDSKECTKTRIACFESSFHGRSMGALSVTSTSKYQLPFTPLIPGIDVGKINDLEGLASLVGEDTCAVIIEPIQGEGGINVAKTEWLAALRQRCDEVGAVLIFDEIQCGLYRTGTLWAHSPSPIECHPDIVTMAKPLANGYPIGSVLLRDSVASTMTAGTHGTTFGGSPMACAVGYHVLSRLSDRSFVAQIAETSAYLAGRLAQLPKWFPNLLQPTIRGRGLITGLGFKDEKYPGQLVPLARERGVFVLTAGKDVVRLVPSLNIGKSEVDLAVDVIESCLGEMR